MFTNFSRYKVLLQITFWICSILFAIAAFDVASDHQLKLDISLILRALIPNIGFAIAVYTNLYLLVPKFLRNKSYVFYTFWLIVLLSAVSAFIQFALVLSLHTQSFADQFLSMFSSHFFTAAFYVGITSLVKFIKDWVQLQQITLKLSQIEREKLEAELNTLKSQLNPHFLFNCLNNIYSLALNNAPKTPDIILKLSEMMRYVLYESRENFIPVKKELEFLANFIELQRIRLNNKVDIAYQIDGPIPDLKVIPLIFEPFIDNAFKHGINQPAENPYIDILVKFEVNSLHFTCANNFRQATIKSENKNSGIGLKNVEKRLKFLYEPSDYELRIEKTDSLFTVKLSLNLK